MTYTNITYTNISIKYEKAAPLIHVLPYLLLSNINKI